MSPPRTTTARGRGVGRPLGALGQRQPREHVAARPAAALATPPPGRPAHRRPRTPQAASTRRRTAAGRRRGRRRPSPATPPPPRRAPAARPRRRRPAGRPGRAGPTTRPAARGAPAGMVWASTAAAPHAAAVRPGPRRGIAAGPRRRSFREFPYVCFVCHTQRLFEQLVKTLSTAPAGRGRVGAVGWEEELFAYLDDLEGQAAALYDAERAPELADRSRAEYQQVTLAARLMASVDREVTLDLLGVGAVDGPADPGRHRLVPAPRPRPGLGGPARGDRRGARRFRPRPARGRLAGRRPPRPRRGTPPALRRGRALLTPSVDGRRHDGVVLRVGADFVEVPPARPGGWCWSPSASVAAVQSRR